MSLHVKHLPNPSIRVPLCSSPPPVNAAETSAYENYLRLPELRAIWTARDSPEWSNETVLKPALQGLEITFRSIYVALSDGRSYSNRREWTRRLQSISSKQIELISVLFEEEGSRGVPLQPKPTTSSGSFLPRLATWDVSADVAAKIVLEIECHMRLSDFTLGLGEPNLAGKPTIDYDLVCRPSLLRYSFERIPEESRTLFNVNQILESWLFVAGQLLNRIAETLSSGDDRDLEKASGDTWLLERIWKLLMEIEDLHLLMDPDDFLRLKNQLGIKANISDQPFCFRSKSLVDVTNRSKELKTMVPGILGVEVDPNGGPRVQDAAMFLLRHHQIGSEKEVVPGSRIHLLQAFQAVDAAVKKFFFSYRQLVVVVMGNLEALSNSGGAGDEDWLPYAGTANMDPLTQIFSEPPYLPSLDAAKTFLGDYYFHRMNRQS